MEVLSNHLSEEQAAAIAAQILIKSGLGTNPESTLHTVGSTLWLPNPPGGNSRHARLLSIR